MNIFALHPQAREAARMLCDKHVPKMAVESAQMLASALIRHGATPDEMPLTKKGTPYRGGYHRHPCTVWAGESKANFIWLAHHGHEICLEYTRRFRKIHSCEKPIIKMILMMNKIPYSKGQTQFPQCMPDEYKNSSDPVEAYRDYYMSKHFAKWKKGRLEPAWYTVRKNEKISLFI